MAKKKVSRRSVMRAYGEYVDFCKWLDDAKKGINIDEDDPSTGELALIVKNAQHRANEALLAYLGHDEDGEAEDLPEHLNIS
ncbi:hypothetical protein [Sulfitobacter sp. R18_1]|uniref:hypothetical protein n=1 Tax=Sulfitobacter sp. R18_1 TaxID=2821104 RepID=UPI001ADCA6A7|nr:hypothetical protein [Sulfitobacter sp. R18_1]MBO9428095.1 hypothetical protein [Sulfitobacter sp. R18_1]